VLAAMALVIVLMKSACVSARFGLERRGQVSQLRAETSEHLFEHVVFG